MTPAELATKADIAERYAREWLSHQAASGYITYDHDAGRFGLSAEQAMVFAEPESPVYLQGGFDLAGDDGEPGSGGAGVPHREGSWLGRAVAVPVLCCRSFFSPRLSQQPCCILAAGAGGHRGQTRAWCDGG